MLAALLFAILLAIPIMSLTESCMQESRLLRAKQHRLIQRGKTEQNTVNLLQGKSAITQRQTEYQLNLSGLPIHLITSRPSSNTTSESHHLLVSSLKNLAKPNWVQIRKNLPLLRCAASKRRSGFETLSSDVDCSELRDINASGRVEANLSILDSLVLSSARNQTIMIAVFGQVNIGQLYLQVVDGSEVLLIATGKIHLGDLKISHLGSSQAARVSLFSRRGVIEIPENLSGENCSFSVHEWTIAIQGGKTQEIKCVRQNWAPLNDQASVIAQWWGEEIS